MNFFVSPSITLLLFPQQRANRLPFLWSSWWKSPLPPPQRRVLHLWDHPGKGLSHWINIATCQGNSFSSNYKWNEQAIHCDWKWELKCNITVWQDQISFSFSCLTVEGSIKILEVEPWILSAYLQKWVIMLSANTAQRQHVNKRMLQAILEWKKWSKLIFFFLTMR